MFSTHLLIVSCAVTLFGQGLCFTTSRVTTSDEQSNYTVFQELKTWDDAREYCDSKGMALAYIMTYQEQDSLRSFIVENNLLPEDEESGYWLGARAEDTIWRWEHNEKNPRDNNFMAGWHWYKPDYKARRNGNVKECMELQYINNTRFDRSLSWNDLWCEEKRRFVCQIIDSSEKLQ